MAVLKSPKQIRNKAKWSQRYKNSFSTMFTHVEDRSGPRVYHRSHHHLLNSSHWEYSSSVPKSEPSSGLSPQPLTQGTKTSRFDATELRPIVFRKHLKYSVTRERLFQHLNASKVLDF